MAIDHQRIAQFVRDNPARQKVAAAVRQIGFTISWVVEDRPQLWGFYLKPARNLKELLGTNREILLWVSEYAEFQARELSRSEELISKERPRLCDDVAIVVTGDPRTRSHVEEASKGAQIQFVGFSLDDFDRYAPAGGQSLLVAIQEQFFTRDLYYVSNAITNRRAFFGREKLVHELLSTIRAGNTHLALFGLRKMGKTSLLYRLIDELNRNRSVLHVHLDMQRIDSLRPRPDYFLWSIGQQLHSAHADVRAIKDLRLFGRYDRFPAQLGADAVFEDFDYDVGLLLGRTDKRYLFMFDEIELMSPETPGSEWGDGYVRAWRFLRGIDQSHPGRLRFLVAGTNPRCIEANVLGGRENPTYNYFTKQYLAPLSTDESAELLSSLGRRMGLKWSPAAASRSHSLVGGHPFLLRLLGSAIHRARYPRDGEELVPENLVVQLVPQFIGNINATLSQMIEVLGDHYRNELYLLETLAAGKISEFQEMAMEFPDDVAHLVGYGLLASGQNSYALSVDILQSWLQTRRRSRAAVSKAPTKDGFERGALIDAFTIEEVLGTPGGFGCVYRARYALAAR